MMAGWALGLARENEVIIWESVALPPMIDKTVYWSNMRYPNGAISVSAKVVNNASVFVHPTSLQLVLNALIGNCFRHGETGQLVVDF